VCISLFFPPLVPGTPTCFFEKIHEPSHFNTSPIVCLFFRVSPGYLFFFPQFQRIFFLLPDLILSFARLFFPFFFPSVWVLLLSFQENCLPLAFSSYIFLVGFCLQFAFPFFYHWLLEGPSFPLPHFEPQNFLLYCSNWKCRECLCPLSTFCYFSGFSLSGGVVFPTLAPRLCCSPKIFQVGIGVCFGPDRPFLFFLNSAIVSSPSFFMFTRPFSGT